MMTYPNPNPNRDCSHREDEPYEGAKQGSKCQKSFRIFKGEGLVGSTRPSSGKLLTPTR